MISGLFPSHAALIAACSILIALPLAGCGNEKPLGGGELVVERETTADTINVRNVSGSRWGDDLRLLEELRISGNGASEQSMLGKVTALDVDRQGGIYLYDTMLRVLRAYSVDGRLLRQFGRVGEGPGEFRNVLGLAVLVDGRIAVRDAARVLVFNADDETVAAWPVGAGIMLPAPDVLVADTVGGVFTVVPAGVEAHDGALLFRQAYLHLDQSGTVTDSIAKPISPDLPPPSTPFSVRRLVTLSPEGAFVSAVSDRYEIELREPDGGIRRIVRDGQSPVDLQSDELSAHRSFFDEIARRNPEDRRVEMPTTKPLLRTLRIARDGRIWAQVHAPAVVAPGAPGAESPLEARNDWKEPEVWDVFDPDGDFLGRIELPLGASALAMRDEFIWGTVPDENDVPSVVRSEAELVEANSKLGLIAGITGAVAVVPAGILLKLAGAPATLVYGA